MSVVSLNALSLCCTLHRCEPTAWCGYFLEIVYDVHACNMCDVKTERWRHFIFASRKYELSPPFSFHNVTQVTRANVIHNLVEISTPSSWFAPDAQFSRCFLFRPFSQFSRKNNPFAQSQRFGEDIHVGSITV